MDRRRDERIGRQPLTGDAERAIMMSPCPVVLEKRILLSSGRHDAYRTVKPANRGATWRIFGIEVFPVEIDEMPYPAREEYDFEQHQRQIQGL